MKRKNVIKCLLSFGISLALFTSCTNDINLLNVSPEITIDESLVLPIGEANVSVADLLTKFDTTALIQSDATDVFFELKDSSEFKFRDIKSIANTQPFVESIYPSPSATVTFNSQSEIQPVESDFFFDLGINSDQANERIDSIFFNSTKLSIIVKVNNIAVQASNLQFTLTFPGNKIVNSNGSPYIINYSPAAYNVATDFLMSDIKMITSGGVSGIPVHLMLNINPSSFPLTIGPSSKIEVDMQFSNADFKVAYGLFKPAIISTNTLQRRIDVGSSVPGAYLRFANPTVNITATSNIGAYLSFYIDYVKAFKENDPSYTPVYAWFNNHTTHNTSVSFDAKPATPGLWITKVVPELNSTNGEINKLYDNPVLPDMMEYKFSVVSAYNSDNSADFITPDAKIKVNVNAKIPFYLNSGSNYTLTDSILDLGQNVLGGLDSVNIDKVILVLKLKNAFPFKVNLNLTKFYDSNNDSIPVTFKRQYQIDPPQVDANGLVVATSITPQTVQIELTNQQIEDLKKTNKLVFDLKVAGMNETTPIHLTPQNSFGIKFGIFIKGSKTINMGNNN